MQRQTVLRQSFLKNTSKIDIIFEVLVNYDYRSDSKGGQTCFTDISMEKE